MQNRRSLLIFLNLQFILVEILLYGAETTDVPSQFPSQHASHHGGIVDPGLGGLVSSRAGQTSAERPFFEIVGPRNVTVMVGQTALLRCKVKSLGDRTVSWIRKRDLHVLSSHVLTFTSDARFSVIHPEQSDDWSLEIRYVQKRDGGVFECQVNTEPKMNLAILVNVEDREMLSEQGIHSTRPTKEALADIWGPDEVYVKTGSTISLTCSVNVHSNPPGSVYWYHGSTVVDFNSPRGGISLETEKTDSGTTSKLSITKAVLSDSGNYSCVPSNSGSTSVWVHVLNGEHPAAMREEHGSSSKGSATSSRQSIAFLFLAFFTSICQLSSTILLSDRR